MKKNIIIMMAFVFTLSLFFMNSGSAAALKSCTQIKDEAQCKQYPACMWVKEKQVKSGKKTTIVPANCADNPNFKRKKK